MPSQYIAIKEKLMKDGMDEQSAKSHAAAIYNAQRKPGDPPVTKNYDETHKEKK